MILILSEQDDLSTSQVIDWLMLFNKKYILINSDDKIDIEYNGNDILFKVDKIEFNLSSITSYWYRRGFLNINENKTNIIEFDSYLSEEMYSLLQFIYYKLEKIHHIDAIKNTSVNKLIVNHIAKEIGLKIPEEYIFSNKTMLKKIIENSQENFITKSICGSPTIEFKEFIINNYTSRINIKNVVTEKMFPSLVQNNINKKYELRIYYLNGKCYSMAIFSQKDNQTNIDFRNYNEVKPNRRVPYKLPSEIEKKIDSLMKKLDFNSGSIDIIVTPDDEYVFLEVNPVGQFGMTSFPCNYNLEKLIAEYL